MVLKPHRVRKDGKTHIYWSLVESHRKAHRQLPKQKPDVIIDVPLPPQCPDCSGDTEESHTDHQFQVEIPRRPVVRRFDIHVGQCTRLWSAYSAATRVGDL